jgi:cell division septal protein FtsQ
MKAFVKIFLGLLSTTLFMLIGLSLFQDGTLRNSDVEFDLDPLAGDEQMIFEKIQTSLKPKLKMFEHQWVWQSSLSEIMKTVEADSRVQSVHVLRRFPNRLVVIVRPKKTAANLLDQDGYLHPVAMDGSLLPPLLATQAPDRPTLRGKKFFNDENIRQKAVKLLDEMPEHGLFSKAAISELRYIEKTGFEMILVGSGVTVAIGDESLVHKADHIEQVLSYMQNEHVKGRVIDARFAKKVVVKLRKQP